MDDNREVIEDIFRHCSHYSLLVIDRKGALRRIFCPFRVVSLVHGPRYRAGEICVVEAIEMSRELVMLYVIREKQYPFDHFRIISG
jgi:hypothetical protein